MCYQNNREKVVSQAKTDLSINVLCDRTPIALSADSTAQIDAAQQCSQFLDGDLKASRAGRCSRPPS